MPDEQVNLSKEQISQICIEILERTNDGDDLAPEHLALIQIAVNVGLNPEGENALHQLLEQARSGYQKPAFHGIEHLSIDVEGYVYWKGQPVEHYNIPWAYSDEAKAQAHEIARRCRELEAGGIEVNMGTAVWGWDDEISPSL